LGANICSKPPKPVQKIKAKTPHNTYALSLFLR
jgi:hypothetical protein